MQTHDLVQGSKEWHDHRAKYDNASDLPAAAGVSKYKTRDELMTEYKTGITQEVGASLQVRFDNGHRFEALARPLAEAIVGKALYPVIGTLDSLGASFDGLDIMDDINWEHKTLNDSIRACETADDLDEMYKLQMDQQMLLSGAEKTLFSATQWDEYDNLIEEKHLWYTTTPERMQRVKDIWAQFHLDLETFVPTVKVEPPKAQVVLELPALYIQARGEITTNNMQEYGEALAKRLEEVRSIALITDQDFANAKQGAKLLRENIKQAQNAKEAMLSETATVGEAARMIDAWCEDMRLTALQLEKDVENADKLKKIAMINDAQGSFTSLTNSLDDKVKPIRLNIAMPNFAEAIKGKSKFSSMQESINALLAIETLNAKSLANSIMDKQAYLKEMADGYEFLFSDLQQIIFKAQDDFQLLVTSRISKHVADEAEKLKAIKEQAEADARAKIEAEAKAQAADKARQEIEAKIIAEAKNDDGAVVDATFNESDFNKVFEVKEQPAVQVGSVRPTAQSIINLVAKTYNVDTATANRWLAQSFGELRAA